MVTEVKASHILVKTEEEAKKLYDEIKNGASFAKIAEEKSLCTSGQNGGDLGFVTYDQANYDKDFLEGFKNLGEGQISDPVKSQFGYHIIKATGLKDSQVTPFDQVKDQIKAQLLQEKKNQAYQDKLKEWKETLKVKTYEDRM